MFTISKKYFGIVNILCYRLTVRRRGHVIICNHPLHLREDVRLKRSPNRQPINLERKWVYGGTALFDSRLQDSLRKMWAPYISSRCAIFFAKRCLPPDPSTAYLPNNASLTTQPRPTFHPRSCSSYKDLFILPSMKQSGSSSGQPPVCALRLWLLGGV